jgi:hypothetical protein
MFIAKMMYGIFGVPLGTESIENCKLKMRRKRIHRGDADTQRRFSPKNGEIKIHF